MTNATYITPTTIEESFINTTSGKKVSKKVRQMYNRECRKQAHKAVTELYKTFEEHIRPKPRFIPQRLWRVLQRMVLTHYDG